MTEFIVQGRIVWGHPGKGQMKTDPVTKQPKMSAKTGQQIEEWSFGLAVEKTHFNEAAWPHMAAVAGTAFPQGAPADFAWKIKDGDTAVDAKGNPFNQMEGRAGCQIMAISTSAFASPLYKMNPATNQYDQISAEEIKCGDYVAVSVMVKFNGSNGIYLNPQGVIHVGYGQEIVTSSFDVGSTFSGFQPQLPAGASATPVMGGAPLPSTGAALPAPAAPAQVAAVPAAPVAAPAAPGALPPPAAGFVANAGAPAPVGNVVQPAAQPLPQAMPVAPATALPATPSPTNATPVAVAGLPPAR